MKLHETGAASTSPVIRSQNQRNAPNPTARAVTVPEAPKTIRYYAAVGG